MKKDLILTKDNIKPIRDDFEVIGVFNPGIIIYNDCYIMIARVAERPIQNDNDNYLVPLYKENNGIVVEKVPKNNPDYDYSDTRVIKNHKCNYLTSISHFCVLKSNDGVNFKECGINIIPETKYEEYGIEDPRITKIGKKFYITYSAISSLGINVVLMETVDFVRFERKGIILHSDNKDTVIFPKKINKKYLAFHRPSISNFGRLDMWTAESSNLLDWGNHKVFLESKELSHARIGAGCVPFLTKKGWVEIWHYCDEENNYYLSAMLLDKKNPQNILKINNSALISPSLDFETNGFFGNVVFTCGVIPEKKNIKIYYGASDCCIGLAEVSYDELWRFLYEKN